MQIEPSLITHIHSLPAPLIIAVSGFGGSGKSTFAEMLGQTLHAPVVGVDSFTKDKNIKDYSDWDFIDYARLEREVIVPFLNSEDHVTYGHYDWNLDAVSETRIIPVSSILVIEGVGLLRPKLLDYFGYTIWIDCSLPEAIRRGKKRDREVHHNPQDEHWDGIWKQNDEEYFAKYKPKEIADLVIENGAAQG